MLPAHIAENIRRQILYYLQSTFQFGDKQGERAFERFLNDPGSGIFKGPWVALRRPFRQAPQDADTPFDIAVPFHPFRHQWRAWKRLTSKPNFTTVRSGRPRISREQRRKAWPCLKAFQSGLKRRNLITFDGAVHQARLAVEQGASAKYAHVLVDEVQDFSLEALRLIKALSPAEEGAMDPLCVVGDGHQRIYRRHIPLSRAGIEVRGRSRRLKINYRTSEQIRQYAQGMLEGLDIDDFQGGKASVVADHSVFKGPEPMIKPCADLKAETNTVLSWVQYLLNVQHFATHEICICPYKPDIRQALTAVGIPTYELKPKEEDPGAEQPGIRLGTMKRIKGLEFRAIAMACADPKDPMNSLQEADALDRCERYVAATRARERLLITVAGRLDRA